MNNSPRKTVRDIVLALEGENRMTIDISHRGGKYGAKAGDVVAALFPTISLEKSEEIENQMPAMFGVYCNYLGGGLRGSIARSDYDRAIPAKYAKRLDSFTRECARRYEELENEIGLNSDYPDGETNWEAEGTRKVRAAGVERAY